MKIERLVFGLHCCRAGTWRPRRSCFHARPLCRPRCQSPPPERLFYVKRPCHSKMIAGAGTVQEMTAIQRWNKALDCRRTEADNGFADLDGGCFGIRRVSDEPS